MLWYLIVPIVCCLINIAGLNNVRLILTVRNLVELQDLVLVHAMTVTDITVLASMHEPLYFVNFTHLLVSKLLLSISIIPKLSKLIVQLLSYLRAVRLQTLPTDNSHFWVLLRDKASLKACLGSCWLSITIARIYLISFWDLTEAFSKCPLWWVLLLSRVVILWRRPEFYLKACRCHSLHLLLAWMWALMANL